MPVRDLWPQKDQLERGQGTSPRRTMPERRLACVGDNCVDRYLAPISRRFAAGNAVNVAVGLFRAGFAVDYFGAVGDDAAGEQIVAALAVGRRRRSRAPPERANLSDRDTSGGRRTAVCGFSEGAAEQYLPSPADLADLQRRPWFTP